MAQFASDAFTGTEGTTLSTYDSAWQKPAGYTGNAEISSNRVRVSDTNVIAIYYNTGSPGTANYSVGADLVFKDTDGGTGYAGVVGRLDISDASVPDHYRLRWGGGGTDKWQLTEISGGTAYTRWESETTVSITDESTHSLRLEMDHEVRAYVDDVLVHTITSPLITAAGKAGIYLFQSTTPSDTVGVHIDNFSADDLIQALTPALFTNTTTFYSALVGTAGSAQELTPALFTNTQTFYEPTVQRIQIKADYERSSVNLSGSSVTGVGDSAVIVIKPRVQESEYLSSLTGWYEPSAKLTGVDGFRPTFRFSDYAASYSDGKYINPPWASTRKPMFSYDRETWNYFDTVTVNSTYIEFRHNTAFTSDTIYVSKDRQISAAQTGEWIESLETTYASYIEPTTSAAAFTPTLTSWPAQAFIADEFSSQTNELSETIPATPFYAFQINDTSLMPSSGSKKLAVMICGVHAGEDSAFWQFREAINAILADTATGNFIRKHFKILVYPLLQAPGRAGGGWRGQFTQGTGGADDLNRHFKSVDGLETVSKPKAAMVTDMDGAIPQFMFDMHNTSTVAATQWGAFVDNAKQTAFMSVLSTNSGITFSDMGDTPSECVPRYFQDDIGVPFTLATEIGGQVPVTDQQFVDYGIAFAETIADFFQALEPALYSDGDTFHAATVTPGAVTLFAGWHLNNDIFYTHAVVLEGGPQTLLPELVVDGDAFHAATVTPGAVNLAPSIYTDADTFHAAEVAVGFNLQPPALADPDTFYPAIVSGGAVTLAPDRFEDGDTFYPVTLTFGQILSPDLFVDGDIFHTPSVDYTLPLSLSDADLDAIADRVWAKVLESTYTSADLIRIILSAVSGKSTGVGTTTERYLSIDESIERIVVTFDSSNNRDTVIRDGT